MIIQPRVWGFICTTAHPLGCELNVRDQIERAGHVPQPTAGPKSVLVIGASTGYGLAARITAAFGYGAATLGVFLEKPGRAAKPGSAGWYNSSAFHQFAARAGLQAVSINGDAFSTVTRACAVDAIKRQFGGQVDLVIYSLAAPLRRMPNGNNTARTVLKPIGETFNTKTIDTDLDTVIEIMVEPASQQEISDTVAVMGGEDWGLWIAALNDAGVLAKDAITVAYSYIGPQITWPIYWHGTIGRAKQHLELTAGELRQRYAAHGLRVQVAIMKSVVTQASAAIPAMPLYLSVVKRIMQSKNLDEDCCAQQQRLFRDFLCCEGGPPAGDAQGRWRLDDRELRADVQQACLQLWPRISSENLLQLTAYAEYKREFLRLFGFAREDVNYQADADPQREFACLSCE